MPKILAIIPARGGSKGVPRKNIKLLGGKPLIYYILSAALKSKALDYVAVSSEDEEILNITKKYGEGNNKFILVKRPKYLSKDTTLAQPVLKHAIDEIENKKGYKFDYIVMLQATTPFVVSSDIDNAVKKIIKTKADSVVSVYQINDTHPVKIKRIIKDRLYQYIPSLKETVFRRQDLSPAYKRNGGIYISKRNVIMKQNLIWGKVCRPYIMSPEMSIDINNNVDFSLAETMLEKNLHRKN